MSSPSRRPPYCTRAITGASHPMHQPIYVCDTCHPPPGLENALHQHYCVCKSCAYACHDGHDVYSVGDGPMTCDCVSIVTTSIDDDDDDDEDIDENDREVDACDEDANGDGDVAMDGARGGGGGGGGEGEEDEISERRRMRRVRCACALEIASRIEALRLGYHRDCPSSSDVRDDIDDEDDDDDKCGDVVVPPTAASISSPPDDATYRRTKYDIDVVGVDAMAEPARCCLECRTHLGEYAVSSYALPILTTDATCRDTNATRGGGDAVGEDGTFANDDGNAVDDGGGDGGGGIRWDITMQALALSERTRDTHWLSVDDIEEMDDRDVDIHDKCRIMWSDLEILAGSIYRHHAAMHTTTTGSYADDFRGGGGGGEVDGDGDGDGGGAEWWVQVKRPGSTNAPVDLHYDKDEELAESFDLGRFPHLSTVTYLTENEDNAPTIIFPRRYVDPEDMIMGDVMLCHPRAGKHIAFDGRLLHGAPAHPSLLRRRSDGIRSGRRDDADDDDIGNHHDDYDGMDGTGDGRDAVSSLRVTFLVNLWTSRRPAGVNVLSESIRESIMGISSDAMTSTDDVANIGRQLSSLRRSLPLTFETGRISVISIPGGGGTSGVGRRTMGDAIILPFVSKGATWMDDDDDDDVEMGSGGMGGYNDGDIARDEEDDDEVFEDVGGGDGVIYGENDEDLIEDDDDDDDDNEEDDDDDDLYLVLSPFATAEYMDDEADTFIFSYENGRGARLVRGRELDVYPWRKKYELGHSESTRSIEFLSYLRGGVPSFVSSVIADLYSLYKIDVRGHRADHVCYRTESFREYHILVGALLADVVNFRLLVESEIGGRQIATFKLATPIEVRPHDGDSGSHRRIIDVVEIPSPKDGSPYPAGLEHVEFVVGDDTHESPMNSEVHRSALTAWMEMHPSVPWNIKAIGKSCNPDVSIKLELSGHGQVSAKFHLIPLEDVIKFERNM